MDALIPANVATAEQELEALRRELAYVCYRNRRLHGETAWRLADEFSDAAGLEARYQVEQAEAVEAWEREQAHDCEARFEIEGE